jgi:hypothetical protein
MDLRKKGAYGKKGDSSKKQRGELCNPYSTLIARWREASAYRQ